MEPFPHHYSVTAAGRPDSNLTSCADDAPALTVAPPPQFGGPGDQWSPESLFVAAVANCLILSFRAVATASRFEWCSIDCVSEGTLDKIERTLKFTSVLTRVKLVIPADGDREAAERLLDKAHRTCLVSNSLACDSHLESEVLVEGA